MRQAIDKLATTILRLILPITALLLPLFFLPITTEFFLINKNLLLLISGSLALLAWSVRNITRRRIHISLTPATVPFLLLSFVYIISAIFQPANTYMSLMGRTALIIALTFLFLGVTSSQKNKDVLNLSLGALIIAAVAASLVSLYSYLGLNAALAAPAWLKAKTFNPVGGPIPFLTLLLPLIPTTIYLAVKSNRWQLKSVLFLASGLFIGASLSQISQLLPSSGNQILLLPLSAGWSIAVDIFKNARTALIGTGPETYINAFSRLKPVDLNNTVLWDSRFNSGSNELFTLLTTVGLVGAVLWLAAFLRPVGSAIKLIAGKKSNPQLTASLLLLVGLFIANLVVPANPVLLGTSVIAITLVSLALKLEGVASRDVSINLSATPVSTTPNPYGTIPESAKSGFELLPWFATVTAISLLLFFWYYQSRSYSANMATYKALTSLNTNATESYNQQIRAYTLEPANPFYRLNFSQTSLALANSIASQPDLSDQDKANVTQLVQQAIREAKIATDLDPDNVLVWENLANTYRQLINFAQGASDWAIASYGQAISLDPTNPRLHLELGGIYYALKDYDTAIRQFEQAVRLKSDWANAHYNLAAGYNAKKEYPKALSEMRIVIQLLDPNSPDYQTAQNELKELEKMVPATQPTGQEGTELTQPTPIPTSQTQVDLPEDSAPNIPSPTSTPTPSQTPSVTPTN